MPWTTPVDRLTGYIPSATDWNAAQDNLAFLAGAAGATVAIIETTTSTTFTDLTTAGPAVTVNTGTHAIVILSCLASNGTASDGANMSVAVSGATTLAAVDNGGAQNNSTNTVAVSSIQVMSGLTAGSNTFTAKYRAVTGGTASFLRRYITVIPLP